MSTVTFGQRLMELRQAAGISRRDLAARAQIALSYLEKIEHGYSPAPAARTIRALERVLGAPDALFALSGKLPPDLERDLICCPLLVQVARIAAQWDAAQLAAWLRAQGVEEGVLQHSGTISHWELKDERDGGREPITAELKRATFARDGHECVYCSAPSVLEVDHICPVSLGGTNEPENLITACSRCNAKKGNRSTPFVMVFGRFRSEVEANG